MARAVNQSIAWIIAFILSLIVFGIGLAIVFSLKPKRSDNHGGHADHAASEHESRDESEHHDTASPEHPADSEHHTEHAKPKIEHEDPHAKDGGDEETEITPASVKAKADEHAPADSHH